MTKHYWPHVPVGKHAAKVQCGRRNVAMGQVTRFIAEVTCRRCLHSIARVVSKQLGAT